MPANTTEIEKRLWDAADELRANSKLKSSEYSVPVLGLIFLRYADAKFAKAEAEIKAVKKFLAKNLSENEIPDVQAALVFFNEHAEIQADGAPQPAMKLEQLKAFMRQKAKERPIGQIQLAAVKAALPE